MCKSGQRLFHLVTVIHVTTTALTSAFPWQWDTLEASHSTVSIDPLILHVNLWRLALIHRSLFEWLKEWEKQCRMDWWAVKKICVYERMCGWAGEWQSWGNQGKHEADREKERRGWKICVFIQLFCLHVWLSNLLVLPSTSIIVIASEENVGLRAAARVCGPAWLLVCIHVHTPLSQ